jgi:hypothetical protein
LINFVAYSKTDDKFSNISQSSIISQTAPVIPKETIKRTSFLSLRILKLILAFMSNERRKKKHSFVEKEETINEESNTKSFWGIGNKSDDKLFDPPLAPPPETKPQKGKKIIGATRITSIMTKYNSSSRPVSVDDVDSDESYTPAGLQKPPATLLKEKEKNALLGN